MSTKHTDREILGKGIRLMFICLLLMFAGPFMLHVAFANQEKQLFIPILIAGILLSAGAVFLLFKGINTILDSVFKK